MSNRLFLIKAVGAALFDTFCRLGRAWPKEGAIVAEDEFTPEQWEILAAEPMLHIGPAPDAAEVEANVGQSAIEAIKAAISGLSAEDFDSQGKPKVTALKAALPDVPVTAALRDVAWGEVSPPPAA